MQKCLPKRITEYLTCLLLVLASLACLVIPCSAVEENVASAYVYNVENGLCVYDQDGDETVPVGASARLMTGLIACEMLANRLEEPITVKPHMLVQSPDRLGIKSEETMPLSDLVYGLICSGYDDCANALAIHISGSADAFVELMNDKAAELGMTLTKYKSPYAKASEDAVTCAADVARLALAASKNSLFLEISHKFKYELAATNLSDKVTIYNCNALVSQRSDPKYYNSACKGLFSGYEKNAGYSVATVASNGELSYICVVLGAKEKDGTVYSYTAASGLIEKVFEEYSYSKVVDSSTPVCSIPVSMSDTADVIQAYPEHDVTLLVSTEQLEKAVSSYRLNDQSLEAPIEKGATVGFLTVTVDSRTVTVRLIAGQSVERSRFLHIMKSIEDFSKSRVFSASVCCAIALTVVAVYIDYKLRTGSSARRHRRRRY